MKKSFIAGAASLALAAMPVVGAFATDITTMTDTLSVTVSKSCNWDNSASTQTKSQNAFTAGLITYTTVTHVVTCNTYNGYKVTGTFTAFTNGSSSSITIPYSTTVATSGSDTWSATTQATVNGTQATAKQPASGTSGNVMANSGPTPSAGDSFTAIYKVGVTATKQAGTYTATATYTLTSNS